MNWKENKLVGIIALVVMVLIILAVVKMTADRNKKTPEQRMELQKIEELADLEIQKLKQPK